MKRLVTISEKDGAEALLGEHVTVFCLNYIYAGTLVGVSETDLLLDDAQIVYETGPFKKNEYKNAEKIGKQWRVKVAAIESFGVISDQA